MGGSLTMKNGRIDKELGRMHGLDWYDCGARHIIMDVTSGLSSDIQISIISNDMPSDPNDPEALNSNYVDRKNFTYKDFMELLRKELYTDQ